jgi:NitT/TauT family transport system substrate-binding protein
MNLQLNASRLAFLVLLMVFSGCNRGTKTAPEVTTVTTATLNGPSGMAFIKMIEEKPRLDSLVTTDFLIKNEPNQVRALMFREEIDFAVLPSTMGALLYNTSGSYILAAIPVWGTLYLFGRDTTIKTWKDLKNKKVSLMARGMTPDIVFRYLAEKNGLDPDRDMQLDYSFPTHIELSNAIAAGRSQLGVISEPLVSLVMMQNTQVFPILDFNEEWIKLFGEEIPFAQTALLVRKKFAEENPELVDNYLALLEESVNWVNANPEAAAELIVKHGILPEVQTAMESIPRCNLGFSEAGPEMMGIKQYFEVFNNYSPLVLGGKIPDENFFYNKVQR